VELQGAQEDRKAEIFQVSNDDTVVAQRLLEEKQPEEKTNMNYLIKEQEKAHHEDAKGNAAKRYKGDNNMAALGVAAVIEEYALESLTFRDAVACE
nr:zinc finger, CCHC-type [Tanacetum cinerariifolium]